MSLRLWKQESYFLFNHFLQKLSYLATIFLTCAQTPPPLKKSIGVRVSLSDLFFREGSGCTKATILYIRGKFYHADHIV